MIIVVQPVELVRNSVLYFSFLVLISTVDENIGRDIPVLTNGFQVIVLLKLMPNWLSMVVHETPS